MSEEPQDPSVPSDAKEVMQGLYAFYVAALLAGFPEQRAFELVRDVFVTQMATVQAVLIDRREQEG
jgi:hypothetical protein